MIRREESATSWRMDESSREKTGKGSEAFAMARRRAGAGHARTAETTRIQRPLRRGGNAGTPHHRRPALFEMFQLWKEIKGIPRAKPLYSKDRKYLADHENAVMAAVCSKYMNVANGAGLCMFGLLMGVTRDSPVRLAQRRDGVAENTRAVPGHRGAYPDP